MIYKGADDCLFALQMKDSDRYCRLVRLEFRYYLQYRISHPNKPQAANHMPGRSPAPEPSA